MNINEFKKSKYTDRIDAVPAPGLEPFFAKGKKPELIVRGLTGEEGLRANYAADRTPELAELIGALAAGSPAAGKKLGELLGIDSEEPPPEYSRRLAILQMASVNPKFDRDAAIHLAKNYPNLFLSATTKILKLTGLNRVPGKRKGSGEMNESEPLSSCGTETDTCPTP